MSWFRIMQSSGCGLSFREGVQLPCVTLPWELGLCGCFLCSSLPALSEGLQRASEGLVWSRGCFSVTATFFWCFCVSEVAAEVYSSREQTGGALTFPACANMGLALWWETCSHPGEAPPVIAGPFGESSQSSAWPSWGQDINMIF